jgi:hypothetical protein
MNTTTIQHRTRKGSGTSAPKDATTASRRGSSTGYSLPRRFDVHQVERVRTELGGLAHSGATVGVDGSMVEMIDLAALAALHGLVTDHTGIRLERPSVALRATIDFTGHDRVAAALSLDSLSEAA